MRSSRRVRVWPGHSGYTKWSPLTASPKNNARTLETVAALESPRPSPGDLQLGRDLIHFLGDIFTPLFSPRLKKHGLKRARLNRKSLTWTRLSPRKKGSLTK
jgi:hypothetical protein